MKKLRNIDAAREFVRENVPLTWLLEHLGFELHSVARDNVATRCPFHEEEEPSFTVSESKQVYICYGCKEKGDVFTFIQKLESLGHIEAIRQLAEYAGLSLTKFEADLTAEDKRRIALAKSNEKAVARALRVARKSQKFDEWARHRVLSAEILDAYSVGFSTRPPETLKVPTDHIEDLGFDRRSQWINAVVVPITDASGEVMGFRNRPLDGDVKTVGPRKTHPLPIPPVYGFFEARKAIRREGLAILVEGEVDVWQMVAHGFENTIGSFGTSFGEEGIQYLAERGVRRIVVIPDADDGGRKYARRVAMIHHKDVDIKIAFLKGGDPDEVLLSDGPPAIEEALAGAVYGIEFLVREALRKPTFSVTDKIEVLQSLKDVMGQVNRVEEDLATSMLAEALGMDKYSIIDFYREIEPEETELYDVRSERAVIAKMLSDAEFIGESLQFLQRTDFHMAKHSQIFEAIANLYRDGHEVDEDTVAITLEKMGIPSAVKALESIAMIGSSSVSDFMLKTLREKSMRRQLQRIGRGLVSDSANPTLDPEYIAQVMMGGISRVVVGGSDKGRSIESLVDTVMERMIERLKNPNIIIGHDLGPDWQSLNRTIHGLQPGRLVIFAAPSGVGKTSSAIGWFGRIGVELGVPSLWLTLETDDETLTNRMISNFSRVEQEKIATGHLSSKDVTLVQDAAARIGAAPIKILPRGRTLEEVQAIVRHDQMVRGTQFLVLDYVQLMSLANADRISRHQELGKISEGLLALALETGVSIMALAQINRDGAKKGTKTDETDIAEAYKITQDADIFVTMADKSQEELEVDGPEKGNKMGGIHKNRRDGRIGVKWNIEGDLAIQRVREIPS